MSGDLTYLIGGPRGPGNVDDFLDDEMLFELETARRICANMKKFTEFNNSICVTAMYLKLYGKNNKELANPMYQKYIEAYNSTIIRK